MTNQKYPRVLVTGGAGYIGSLLVPMLLEKGHTVTVVDSLLYGQPTLVSYFIDPNFHFVKGDIRDKKLMRELVEGNDAVIHLAALVGEPLCRRDPRACYEVNRDATVTVSNARTKGQPFIFSSTGSVYGKVESGLCTEETETNPVSDYAIAKLDAENSIRQKGNYVIYRFATAFGLSPRLRLDLMPNDFVYQALKQKMIIVFEAKFKRTFAHVRDLASSLAFALENFDAMKNQAYNVGDESMNYTKEDIARKILEKVQYHLHFADFGTDPDQRNYEVDYTKVKSAGFRLAVDMDRGLDELIKGYAMLHIPNPYSNTGHFV